MAANEPSEHQISQVIEFTGLHPLNDRFMVLQALKSNGCNIENVIYAYLEDSAGFKQKFNNVWDDSMFSADRDGSSSFHIESMNQNDTILGTSPPQESYRLAAPSRPPSRNSNRSPLGQMVNWTVPGPQGGIQGSQNQEDEDMQRALRESAQEAGVSIQEQETGVVDSQMSAPYFGPANRTEYDQDSWAMVPMQSTEREITASVPPPSTRKRAAEAPAFLVQGNSGFAESNRLGAFLTILHAIPLARNMLLQSGTQAASYWHNSEWWNGKAIIAPGILTRIQAGELHPNAPEAIPNFEEEIHRLIAFMDSTERSYGTISTLRDLIMAESNTSDSLEKHFYETFATRNPEQVVPLYSQVTLDKVLPGDEQMQEELTEDMEDQVASFGLLETDMAKEDYKHITTLYELLDHVMWSDVLQDGINDESRMAMYREYGEILAIKLDGTGPEEPSITIPEIFYPERWLESRQDDARKIQQEWARIKTELQKLEDAQSKLQEFDSQDGNVKSRDDVLAKQRSQWNTYSTFLENRARFRALEESGFDINEYPDYKSAPCRMTDEEQRLFDGCREMLNWIDESAKELETKKQEFTIRAEKLQAQERYLGQILTDPDKNSRRPKPMTCKKFLLRGVATHPDVVYVCRRRPVNLIEFDDNPPPRDQWWRLALVPNDNEPVKVEKLDFEQVHQRVWNDTKTPFLVYATEEALETPPVALPTPLERFIKAENKAFHQELARENEEAQTERRSIEPLSPSKRKHRSDSMDSMASNRASIGSDDRNIESRFSEEHVIEGIDPSQASQISGSRMSMDLDGTQQEPEVMQGLADPSQVHQVSQAQEGPEMKQRVGLSPFMSATRTASDQGKESGSTGMDILER